MNPSRVTASTAVLLAWMVSLINVTEALTSKISISIVRVNTRMAAHLIYPQRLQHLNLYLSLLNHPMTCTYQIHYQASTSTWTSALLEDLTTP